jgi:hypothetical protein
VPLTVAYWAVAVAASAATIEMMENCILMLLYVGIVERQLN